MSEWAVPSGMTPQDNPGQPKPGIAEYAKRIHDNAVEMRDKFNNLLKNAGIRVEPDLVRFTGAVRIEGTLDLGNGLVGMLRGVVQSELSSEASTVRARPRR